jgi:hypothetical protein
MEPRRELPTDHAEREGSLLVVAGLDAQVAKLAEVFDGELAGRWPGGIPARMVDMALHPSAVQQQECARLPALRRPVRLRLVGA